MKLVDYLSQQFNISKRLAKKYIKEKKVLIDGKFIKENLEIANIENHHISLNIDIKKVKYNLDEFIISNYENVLFLYKRPFMHTERHKLEDSLTISDIVSEHFKEYKLISRLDFETDGVIAAIKDGYKPENVLKKYLAVVIGNFPEDTIVFNKIDYNKRKKVKVLEEIDLEHPSNIKVINSNKNYSLLEITIFKATRHQIRAHLSYLGYPILGDTLYGDKQYKRLMLSCIYTKIDNFEAHSPKKENFLKEYQNLISI